MADTALKDALAAIMARFNANVTSGNRPGAVTSAGTPSLHATAEAVDLQIPGGGPRDHQALLDALKQAGFSALYEGTDSSWRQGSRNAPIVHVNLRGAQAPAGMTMEMLRGMVPKVAPRVVPKVAPPTGGFLTSTQAMMRQATPPVEKLPPAAPAAPSARTEPPLVERIALKAMGLAGVLRPEEEKMRPAEVPGVALGAIREFGKAAQMAPYYPGPPLGLPKAKERVLGAAGFAGTQAGSIAQLAAGGVFAPWGESAQAAAAWLTRGGAYQAAKGAMGEVLANRLVRTLSQAPAGAMLSAYEEFHQNGFHPIRILKAAGVGAATVMAFQGALETTGAVGGAAARGLRPVAKAKPSPLAVPRQPPVDLTQPAPLRVGRPQEAAVVEPAALQVAPKVTPEVPIAPPPGEKLTVHQRPVAPAFEVKNPKEAGFSPARHSIRVYIPGFEDRSFFLNRPSTGYDWAVYDATTGTRVGPGARTRVQAEKLAQDTLTKYGRRNYELAVQQQVGSHGLTQFGEWERSVTAAPQVAPVAAPAVPVARRARVRKAGGAKVQGKGEVAPQAPVVAAVGEKRVPGEAIPAGKPVKGAILNIIPPPEGPVKLTPVALPAEVLHLTRPGEKVGAGERAARATANLVQVAAKPSGRLADLAYTVDREALKEWGETFDVPSPPWITGENVTAFHQRILKKLADPSKRTLPELKADFEHITNRKVTGNPTKERMIQVVGRLQDHAVGIEVRRVLGEAGYRLDKRIFVSYGIPSKGRWKGGEFGPSPDYSVGAGIENARRTGAARAMNEGQDLGWDREDPFAQGPEAGAVAVPEVPEAAARSLAQARDDIRAVFSPASRGEQAGGTANIIRQRTAELAQKRERAAKALEAARGIAPSLSDEEGLAFADAIEAGQQHPNPAMQSIAGQFRQMLNERRDIIRGMGKGKLEHFIENYLPHIWDRPTTKGNVLARIFGRRPLEGSKAFLRKRTIPTTREGVALGLKPQFDNPVDMVLAKVHEMDRYIMGQTILKDMKAGGYAKFVRATQKGPDGWVKINDRIAEVRGPLTEQGAVTIRGHYYAPEPAARVLNNYLSPGLRGQAFFELARGSGNLMNQVQLGMSAFHLMFTSIDAATSKVALAIEQGTRGQIFPAARSLISAPTAPISNLLRGLQVKNAYYGRAGSPAADAVTEALVKGGYRYRMDRFWGGTQAGAFVDALHAAGQHYRAGRIGAGGERALEAVFRAVPAAVETMAKPIMQVVVPLQKAGVAFDLARLELERLGPNATEAQVRAAMAKVVDSVDNRMGQLAYDNLFWNRTLKDLGMVSVRSLGWNIGTFRELLGGGADIPGTLGRVARGEPAVTHRMAYLLALPVTVGALGATLQYLRTGKGPTELKDYYFPKTGDTLPNGRPERVAFASYMKDVYAYSKHPVTTLSHKVHPLVNAVLDILRNEDFYGTEIRHQDDPWVKQLEGVFEYAGRTFQPFSIRNYQQMREAGEGRAKAVQSFFGIVPAPATVQQTKAEEMMSGFLRENLPVGARTKEEADRSRLVARLTALKRQGKDISALVTASKVLRPMDVARIGREAPQEALVLRFKRLRLDQAFKVYDAGSSAERKIFGPILSSKLANAKQRGSLTDEDYVRYQNRAKSRSLPPTLGRRASSSVWAGGSAW